MAQREAALDTIDELTKLGSAYKQSAEGSREGLMSAASRLLTQLMLPSEAILMSQWAQPTHQAVLRLGLDINLFEALAADNGSPKTSKAIADKTSPKVEATLVSRMLRHLAAMGTIRETAADTFAPTPLALRMTDERFRDTVYFIADDIQPVHQAAPAYFATSNYTAPKTSTDGLFQHAYDCKGEHLFETYARKTWMGKRFAGMMNLWSEGRPKWFQRDYYPVQERLIEGAKGETFLVDVGAGSGHDLQQLWEAFREGSLPGKLVLQDRPEIVGLAKVDEGVTKMSHDFLTEQPVKGARAYYLHSILQDWPDDTCQQILRSLIPAMEPGYSKIIINDFIVPDQGAHWAQTCLDWELMSVLGSRHRTRAEFEALVESVGLKLVGVWRHPQGADAVMEIGLA